MANFVFPENSGEAKAYVKALTGVKEVQFPTAPSPDALGGTGLQIQNTFVSVSAAVGMGFGFVAGSVDVNAKVLLQDYWWQASVDAAIPEVNSWTFAAGFRVGIYFIDTAAGLDVNLGLLAIKAQTEALRVQVHILRVGMPKGPNVPVDLAMPAGLDVDKYAALRTWEAQVIDYVASHKEDLVPVLVGASINIPADRLLNQFPAGRYAMRRILHGEHLFMALDRLKTIGAPEVEADEVRAVYSTVFGDSSMIIAGQLSETHVPSATEKNQASRWLNAYDFL